MRIRTKVFAPDQVDPKLLHRLFVADQVGVFVAVQIALINLLWHILPHVDRVLPAGLLHMQVAATLAALCAALALFLLEARSQGMVWLGRVLAVLSILIAAAPVVAHAPDVFGALGRFIGGSQAHPGQGSPAVTAAAFLLLGVVILLIRSRDSVAARIADGLTCGLFYLVLTLASEFLFGLAHIPGASTVDLMAPAAVGFLALVTMVVAVRRAERGALSVFLGYGIGSRIARIMLPILLVLPFLRELARAKLLGTKLIPQDYVTAILVSLATVVSFALIVWLAGLINKMQTEIQDLTLRDELTGLYSVRGFNLLAEQAFRLARRSQEPFGVLFIDMDDLKLINDKLGHNVGSISLVETAKLLTANFRETDIIGRVGGDEFIVAGQFNEQELAVATARLRSSAMRKNHIGGAQFSISLSMGHAATERGSLETLESLIARADEAMYEEKREKKKTGRRGTVIGSEVST